MSTPVQPDTHTRRTETIYDTLMCDTGEWCVIRKSAPLFGSDEPWWTVLTKVDSQHAADKIAAALNFYKLHNPSVRFEVTP